LFSEQLSPQRANLILLQYSILSISVFLYFDIVYKVVFFLIAFEKYIDELNEVKKSSANIC